MLFLLLDVNKLLLILVLVINFGVYFEMFLVFLNDIVLSILLLVLIILLFVVINLVILVVNIV